MITSLIKVFGDNSLTFHDTPCMCNVDLPPTYNRFGKCISKLYVFIDQFNYNDFFTNGVCKIEIYEWTTHENTVKVFNAERTSYSVLEIKYDDPHEYLYTDNDLISYLTKEQQDHISYRISQVKGPEDEMAELMRRLEALSV